MSNFKVSDVHAERQIHNSSRIGGVPVPSGPISNNQTLIYNSLTSAFTYGSGGGTGLGDAVYVVGESCEFKTITEAIEAAIADGHVQTSLTDPYTACILVTPGQYSESIEPGNVAAVITGMSKDSCVVIGNHVFGGYKANLCNLTFTATTGDIITAENSVFLWLNNVTVNIPSGTIGLTNTSSGASIINRCDMFFTENGGTGIIVTSGSALLFYSQITMLGSWTDCDVFSSASGTNLIALNSSFVGESHGYVCECSGYGSFTGCNFQNEVQSGGAPITSSGVLDILGPSAFVKIFGCILSSQNQSPATGYGIIRKTSNTATLYYSASCTFAGNALIGGSLSPQNVTKIPEGDLTGN